MKKILSVVFVASVFFYSQIFAHHAAEGVVDDDIYVMIDQLVSDAHASMTLEDLAFGTTEITIVADNIDELEALMDGGLLSLNEKRNLPFT